MESNVYRDMCAVIARLPEWIRAELSSKDTAARLRAEEALAAIVVNALGNATAGGETVMDR